MTITNTNYAIHGKLAMQYLAEYEKTGEKVNQRIALALYEAHFQAEFNDNVTINDFVMTNGSIEKVRKATCNDEVMRVVFGLNGKAKKGNEEGYTAYQLKAVNAAAPVALAAIRLGEDTITIGTDKNKSILFSGALVFPEDDAMHHSYFALNGKNGLSFSMLLKNAKKSLGLTGSKAEQEKADGSRNHSKVSSETIASSDIVIAKDDKVKIAEAFVQMFLGTTSIHEVDESLALAFGQTIQHTIALLSDCDNGIALSGNASLDGEELVQALKEDAKASRKPSRRRAA